MKITQALLFAVMAYQANAGLFGGDKITTEQTTDNNLNQQGGDSGDATGNQGDQQAGDGPISGDAFGGSGGPTAASSGGFTGGTTQIQADHTNTGGAGGPIAQTQSTGACKGSCVTYQTVGPTQSNGGAVTDSSQTDFTKAGSTNGQTGAVKGGDSTGATGGQSTATGDAGSNEQTQDVKSGAAGNVDGSIGTGDQTATTEKQESTDLSFSPTVALPFPRSVKRYMAGAHNERNAGVLA